MRLERPNNGVFNKGVRLGTILGNRYFQSGMRIDRAARKIIGLSNKLQSLTHRSTDDIDNMRIQDETGVARIIFKESGETFFVWSPE